MLLDGRQNPWPMIRRKYNELEHTQSVLRSKVTYRCQCIQGDLEWGLQVLGLLDAFAIFEGVSRCTAGQYKYGEPLLTFTDYWLLALNGPAEMAFAHQQLLQS